MFVLKRKNCVFVSGKTFQLESSRVLITIRRFVVETTAAASVDFYCIRARFCFLFLRASVLRELFQTRGDVVGGGAADFETQHRVERVRFRGEKLFTPGIGDRLRPAVI